MDTLVHFRHEFMKVNASLAADMDTRKEHVHQHCLAAPDIAKQIKSLDGLGWWRPTSKQRGHRKAPRCRGPRELALKCGQLRDDRLLSSVAGNLVSAHIAGVTRGDCGRHRIAREA